MDVSVILVTHNTKELVDRCLQSILSQECKLSYEIIVVDNGSSDDTTDYLKCKYSHIKVIRNEISHGFGHGVNTGLRIVKGKNIFILEADTELLGGNVIQELSYFLDANKKIGIVAPQLILKRNGEVQRSAFLTFPNLLTFFFEWSLLNIVIGWLSPKFNYPGKYYYTREQLKVKRKVKWVMGGIIMVKNEVIQKAGGFDEDFYLLFEDTDLLKRISNMGYEIWYNPDVKVLHYWAVNQTNISASALHYCDSFSTYYKKHSSTFIHFFYPFFILLGSPIFIFLATCIIITNKGKRIDIKGLSLYRYHIIKTMSNNFFNLLNSNSHKKLK